MSTVVAGELNSHLQRPDRQEDLCFAVWHPSQGSERQTALLNQVLLPFEDDRNVHGNVSFNSDYFLRAADTAAECGGGLALLHSHPGGRGWQTLSPDDHAAEAGHAGRAAALTGRPLVGLTLATGDGTFSARSWHLVAPRTYEPTWAKSVRIVGDRWTVFWGPDVPKLTTDETLARSIATWGTEIQRTLGAMTVGVVGAGSVGNMVVEALARIGVGRLCVFDFDTVKTHNLDRLQGARRLDAMLSLPKAQVAIRSARGAATARGFVGEQHVTSAIGPQALESLRDCDIVFSCVDRPAARAALNALAYAHLVPVVDGGVLVDARDDRLRSAQWRAHVASPGRRCLECLGQYDPGLVQADRDGLLDTPSYLASLPERHELLRGENVYAFSAAAASNEVLAALRMIIAPGGYSDAGAQHTHFATGEVDSDYRGCEQGCPYPAMEGLGETSGLPLPSRHLTADVERVKRSDAQSKAMVKWLARADRSLMGLDRALEQVAHRLIGRRGR